MPESFPIFIWIYGNDPSDYMYGFPAINGPTGGLKVATEQYRATTTPDTISKEVTQDEINQMYNTCIKGKLPALANKCIKAASCLYTVTPDSNFIIDYHPHHDNVIIASPCSGHGFKHSAAIGEVLAQMALDGKSKIDVSNFTFSRLQNI